MCIAVCYVWWCMYVDVCYVWVVHVCCVLCVGGVHMLCVYSVCVLFDESTLKQRHISMME